MANDIRVRSTLATLLALTALLSAWAAAGEPGPRRSQPAKVAEADKYPNPQTASLELFIGPWRVTEQHFDTHGKLVAKVTGTEEVTWILDRHALQRIYSTATDSNYYRAIGTLAWNDKDGKYRGVWFDNAGTAGPTTVEGEWVEENRAMSFTLRSSGKGGSTTLHKVVERFVDEQRRTATTYLVKDGEVTKLLEVEYERAIPCPGGIRPIFDPDVPLKGRTRG